MAITKAAHDGSYQRRKLIYGNSPCKVLRAMGKAGYDVTQALRLLYYHRVQLTPTTVGLALSHGRTGRKDKGAPAKLTADQWAEIEQITQR
jgi:hypothetical protein